MNFLFNTVRCSESISNSENLFSKNSVIPLAMREALATETGEDRIKRMFVSNELGLSPELLYVIKSGSTMVVLAAIYGGVGEMIKARDNFLRKNLGSVFESRHLARRSLSDTMSVAAIKGGLQYGLKFGSFTTLYLLGTMTVANYRNKISVWEHTGFAALLGGFSRIKFGVRGFLVAGGLGGFLGFIAGGIITLSMHFTGTTLEELRYYQHEDHYARILRKRRKDQKLKDEESEPL